MAEQAPSATDQAPELTKQARRLEQEIERLANAIALDPTGVPQVLLRNIKEREERLEAIRNQLRRAEAAPSALDLQAKRLERDARVRLQQLTEGLSRNDGEARRAIQALVTEPLQDTPVKTPEGSRFLVEGETAFGFLFTKIASPRGFEPLPRAS